MFQLCGGISSEPLNPQKCNWAHFIAHALRISTTPVTSSYLKRGLRYSRFSERGGNCNFCVSLIRFKQGYHMDAINRRRSRHVFQILWLLRKILVGVKFSGSHRKLSYMQFKVWSWVKKNKKRKKWTSWCNFERLSCLNHSWRNHDNFTVNSLHINWSFILMAFFDLINTTCH